MKLLRFEKNSCPHCMMVKRFMQEVLDVEPDQVIDCTDMTDITVLTLIQRYKPHALPTLILLDDSGEEIYQVVGMNPQGIKVICGIRWTKHF